MVAGGGCQFSLAGFGPLAQVKLCYVDDQNDWGVFFGAGGNVR